MPEPFDTLFKLLFYLQTFHLIIFIKKCIITLLYNIQELNNMLMDLRNECIFIGYSDG